MKDIENEIKKYLEIEKNAREKINELYKEREQLKKESEKIEINLICSCGAANLNYDKLTGVVTCNWCGDTVMHTNYLRYINFDNCKEKRGKFTPEIVEKIIEENLINMGENNKRIYVKIYNEKHKLIDNYLIKLGYKIRTGFNFIVLKEDWDITDKYNEVFSAKVTDLKENEERGITLEEFKMFIYMFGLEQKKEVKKVIITSFE